MKIMVILSGILLLGCSNINVLRTKEINAVGDEVKALRAEVQLLRAEMDSLRQDQQVMQNRSRANNAMLTSRIAEDYEKVAARLEENQYRLDLLIGKSDKILSKKVVVEKRVSVANTPGLGAEDSVVTEETQVKTLFDLDMEKIYNLAKADFHKGEYKLAFDGFKQVYEKKSGTGMGEDALYWMGLCLLETQQQDKAVTVFQRVLQEYPQGGKLCVTHFRLAKIAETSGKKEEQKQQLNALVQAPQCKNSNEGMKAQAILQALE